MKNNILLFAFFLTLIGCSSSEQSVRQPSSESKQVRPTVSPSVVVASPETATTAAQDLPAPEPSIPASPVELTPDEPALTEEISDTTNADAQDVTLSLLEDARRAYVSAIEAEEAGDSLLAEDHFEAAIQVLNELSEYPDIERNTDFVELSQSVVQDYEVHIQRADHLSDHASVFAIREKLSLLVEEEPALNEEGIPIHDIRGTSVDLSFNEHVARNIRFFMGRGKEYFEQWLRLSGRYMPLMERIFEEEGVPKELTILSMPESGLRPHARSWVGAVGLWQFMKGTGKLYGLRTSWWYDERRDFEKSTRAAARHLKDLYAEFGDWYLVLGAYNAGPGRIFRAARRSGSNDFWEMRSHLPRQTRNYIPQYVAVTRMVKEPHLYGFTGIQPEPELSYETVTIDDCVSLEVLAECAGTDAATMRILNPELLQWCTPPGVTGYTLRIPSGSRDQFVAAYSKIPDDQKRDWAMHVVRKGETLSGIANRYGVSLGLLAEVNNIRNTHRLSIGNRLAIPIPSSVAETMEKVPFGTNAEHRKVSFTSSRRAVERSTPRVQAPKGKTKLVYKVRKGDTIGHIAEWYDVRASDIRNWNGISYGRYIYPGQDLALWVDPGKAALYSRISDMSFAEKQSIAGETLVSVQDLRSTRTSAGQEKGPWIQHTIARGETLDKIARKYGVSVSDIQAWNNLRSSRIKAGDVLEIFGQPDERTRIIGPVRPPQEGGGAPIEPQRTTGSTEPIHYVRKGETLYELSRRYGVDIAAIRQANGLRDSRLSIGQELRIPAGISGFRVHTVRSGETLWALSRQYGVSVDDLRNMNGISGTLQVGEELRIPLR